MNFTTTQFDYFKATNTFVNEASSLDIAPGVIAKEISIKNPKPANSRNFKFTHADKSDDGEDIAGWNYKSNDGINLLIIND